MYAEQIPPGVGLTFGQNAGASSGGVQVGCLMRSLRGGWVLSKKKFPRPHSETLPILGVLGGGVLTFSSAQAAQTLNVTVIYRMHGIQLLSSTAIKTAIKTA